MVIAVVAGVLAYVAFLGFVIWASVRWSRNNLKKRSDSLQQGLGSDAKPVGLPKPATMYRGAETEYDVAGRRVLVSTYYQNRSYMRVSLRLAGGPWPWVTIYPEGKVERFGKALGLNREVQTGDAAFDALAYVDTIDTEDNVRRLLESAAARGAVSDLLKLGYKVLISGAGVEAFVVLRQRDVLDPQTVRPAVDALGRLADALPAFPGSRLEDPRAPRRVAFALMLILSWLGGFAAIGLSSSAVSRTVDGGESVLVFLFGGGVVWLLYVAALVAGVRGRSYALRTVLVGGFVGLVGIPAGGGGLVHVLNQRLDNGAATVRGVTVQEHQRRKGNCRLTVPSWHGEGSLKLFVNHSGSDDLFAPGATVNVHTHPGAFGLEWYEPITP